MDVFPSWHNDFGGRMILGNIVVSKRISRPNDSVDAPTGEQIYPFFVPSSPTSDEYGNYERNPFQFYWTTTTFTWSWRFAQSGSYLVGDPTRQWTTDCSASTTDWPLVRAMVDGSAVSDWQAVTTASTGTYTFSLDIPNGHHIIHFEFDASGTGYYIDNAVNQQLAKDFLVNTTGSPLVTQTPWTAINRFERDQRGKNSSGWAQITYPGSAYHRQPFKTRTIENHSTVLTASEQWGRALTFNQGHLLKREFGYYPTGDICIVPQQKYSYSLYTGAGTGDTPPLTTLRDGPRGEGTLGVISKIEVRPGNDGFYMSDIYGRLLHMSVDGEVTTIVGWRTIGLNGHPGPRQTIYQYSGATKTADIAAYDARWEFVGDWSQVSTATHPATFEELRGFAVAQTEAGPSINTFTGREFWCCDTLHDRILYVNARTMDDVADYEAPHFPPSGYIAPGSPTGVAEVFEFGGGAPLFDQPWCVRMNPFDGKIYWTNYNGGNICRADSDGTNAEVYLQGANNPSDASLGIPSRLGESSLSTATIRASFLVDGAPGTATMCRPQEFDFTSEGDLVWYERYTYAIRKYDVSANTVTTLATPSIVQSAFGAYDCCLVVDREGTCGPVDDIFTEVYTLYDNRYSIAGTFRGRWHSGDGDMINGPLDNLFNIDYVMGIGVGNGRLCASGNAASFAFLEITKRQATDSEPDTEAFTRGLRAYARYDPDSNATIGTSMQMTHGSYGQGQLGLPNAEEMAGWDDTTLDAYLATQGIAAIDIPDVRYFIRWCAIDHEYP